MNNKYCQREIVMVESVLPGGRRSEQPHLIISPAAALQKEPDYYTGLLMSSNGRRDRYTFDTTPDMLERPLDKTQTQVRLHLISSFVAKDVKKLMSKMKRVDFKALLEQVRDQFFVAD